MLDRGLEASSATSLVPDPQLKQLKQALLLELNRSNMSLIEQFTSILLRRLLMQPEQSGVENLQSSMNHTNQDNFLITMPMAINLLMEQTLTIISNRNNL